jgi:hypothetical protein
MIIINAHSYVHLIIIIIILIMINTYAINSTGDLYDRRPVEGYAFAALKLHSMPTGFPLHVSARWALSDNRRDLLRGKARSELMHRNWNLALLTDAIPVNM